MKWPKQRPPAGKARQVSRRELRGLRVDRPARKLDGLFTKPKSRGRK